MYFQLGTVWYGYRLDFALYYPLAVAIYLPSQVHIMKISMLNNQVMLTSWTGLFNVHNGIKQKYVTVCQAKIMLNVLKYLDISVWHRPQ